MSSSVKSRNLLTADQLHRGLLEVAEIAEREKLKVLLVGGVALQLYGSERLTVDLDVVANQMSKSLASEGPLTTGGAKTHTPSGVPLDWIVRDDDYEFGAVFDEALQYGRQLEGIPIPVAGPEYLVVMKMIAGRGKDDLDLIALLQSGNVDTAKARRIVKRLLGAYGAQDFDSRLQEAEWLAIKGRR